MQTPAVLEEFVDVCKNALDADSPRAAIVAAMQQLFSDPADLATQVPAFDDGEVPTSDRGWRLGGEHVLYQRDDLTVMVLDTLPGVEQPPHDHNMTAIIGVFEGCEEQRFWSRTGDGVVPTAGRELNPGDVMPLGERAIHAISAPDGQTARAIHVYLGDIYATDRSVFDPDSMDEHPMAPDRYDQFCRTPS